MLTFLAFLEMVRPVHHPNMLYKAVVNIDQVLNELDDLARNSTDDVFYSRLMYQCQATVGASGIAIAIPTIEHNWIIRAHSGDVSSDLAQSIQSTLSESKNVLSRGKLLTGSFGENYWYASPVSETNLSKGNLILTFSNALSDAEQHGLAEILQAFCEVTSERQSLMLDRFLAEDMRSIHQTCISLEGADDKVSAAQILVNGLATVLTECRVSLSERSTFGRCAPIAVSSVSKLSSKTKAYQDIQALADEAAKQKKTVVSKTNNDNSTNEARSASTTSADTIFMPFDLGKKEDRWYLGMEFSSSQAYAKNCSKLPYVLPSVNTAWKQKSDWLDIPRIVRKVPFTTSRLRSSIASLTKIAVLILLCSLLGFWLLKPKSLLVEAAGTLLPSESKAIFASADGFIFELLVVDNQLVEANQLLIRLKSPSLELQLEELQGKMRALEEESRGIEIAMNQINPNDADVLKQQSLMASKLKDIAIQQSSLQKQKEIVDRQFQDLEIRSPLKGIAVGRDLKQNLQGRPVNRGELLFRVMDIASAWELRLNVLDQDSKYVLDNYSFGPSDEKRMIEYVLDSSPKQRHQATLKSVANRVENQHREGNFLEVRANIFDLPQDDLKVGSNVHAYFDCGQFPTWFVWFRPAIEAARRKLWF